jgi:hypothetical protein
MEHDRSMTGVDLESLGDLDCRELLAQREVENRVLASLEGCRRSPDQFRGLACAKGGFGLGFL